MLTGQVEADETCICGKERNKHANEHFNKGHGVVGKYPVVGLLQRGGEVRAMPLKATNRAAPHGTIKANVGLGSRVYTDDWRACREMDGYRHETGRHLNNCIRAMAGKHLPCEKLTN